MQARVAAGLAADGWLRETVRDELRKAHLAGLGGTDAVVAATAVILAFQAQQVQDTLLQHAAKLETAEAAAPATAAGG